MLLFINKPLVDILRDSTKNLRIVGENIKILQQFTPEELERTGEIIIDTAEAIDYACNILFPSNIPLDKK